MGLIGMLSPPEGWRDRHDAGDFRRAVARVAFAEAEVQRAQERIRVAGAEVDGTNEAIDEWAETDEPYRLLASLGAATAIRDEDVRAAQDILIRWHDEDRKRG